MRLRTVLTLFTLGWFVIGLAGMTVWLTREVKGTVVSRGETCAGHKCRPHVVLGDGTRAEPLPLEADDLFVAEGSTVVKERWSWSFTVDGQRRSWSLQVVYLVMTGLALAGFVATRALVRG